MGGISSVLMSQHGDENWEKGISICCTQAGLSEERTQPFREQGRC